MSCEWREISLGEVCCSISKTFNLDAEKVVLINTSDVFDGKIINHNFVENKNLKGQFKKSFCKNDILYSEIRPANRRFAFVDILDTNYYIASTKLMVIRSNENIVNSKFLYYILTSSSIINILQHAAETRSGTFPQITFEGEVAPLKIKIPDLLTQQKIVKILSSLDDKIELNNRINKNLEEQAQAIFDDMFKGINNGDNYVGDIIIPKRGKNLLSKDAVKGDVPVVAGGLEPATYHNQSNTTAPVITISASGANAGYVNLWYKSVWASDSSYIDYTMTENVYFWYVLLKKRQREIYDAQTGSAQPHIYPQHIANLRIGVLDKNDVKNYVKIVAPLFMKIGQNQVQNNVLAQLRDTLLPKLMSGKIDVDKVEIL